MVSSRRSLVTCASSRHQMGTRLAAISGPHHTSTTIGPHPLWGTLTVTYKPDFRQEICHSTSMYFVLMVLFAALCRCSLSISFQLTWLCWWTQTDSLVWHNAGCLWQYTAYSCTYDGCFPCPPPLSQPCPATCQALRLLATYYWELYPTVLPEFISNFCFCWLGSNWHYCLLQHHMPRGWEPDCLRIKPCCVGLLQQLASSRGNLTWCNATFSSFNLFQRKK